MMHKVRNTSLVCTVLAALLLPAVASAHVVVTPSTVGIGDSQTFDVSVPNEKNSDVTQLKLTIPSGLQELAPTAKPGWQITTTKTGSGDDAEVTSITWSGGTITAGLRDDFTFRAQVPAKATNLDWKAYQTYADGSTVSWDQKPTATSGDDANGDKGPYSVTKVVNDLNATPKATDNGSNVDTLALVVSFLALITGLAAILRTLPKKS